MSLTVGERMLNEELAMRTEQRDQLLAALRLAIALLKESFADDRVWDLYWNKSKEAAPLREALKETDGA